MISVKEYAEKCKKTEQAVYKQLKSQKNKVRLIGHIHYVNGKQWLDEEAVAILDESRKDSPVVILDNNKDQRIEELLQQNEAYKNKIIELQDKLLQNRESILSIEKQTSIAIETTKQQFESYQENTEKYIKSLTEHEKEYQKKIDELTVALEAEKSKTWWQKLRGK